MAPPDDSEQDDLAFRRAKAQRTPHRTRATKLTNEAGKDLKRGMDCTPAEIKSWIVKIREHLPVLRGCDERVQQLMTEEELEDDLLKSTGYDEGMVDMMASLSGLLDKLTVEQATTTAAAAAQASGARTAEMLELENKRMELMEKQLRLEELRQNENSAYRTPRIDPETFSGDRTKWYSFKQSYDSAIGGRNLPKKDKFTFLRSVLKGGALKEIEGYALTAGNYDLAMAMLEETFGNEDLIIAAHHDALFDSPVARNKTDSLIELRTTFGMHMRSLRALKVDTTHISYLCLLRRKLPREIQQTMEIDKPTAAVSGLPKHTPPTVSTLVSTTATSNSDQPIQKHTGPGARLQGEGRSERARNYDPPRCMLCNSLEHFAAGCSQYTTVDARVRQAKSLGRCVTCLKKHFNQQCWYVSCSHCKKKHHTAVCKERENERLNSTSSPATHSAVTATVPVPESPSRVVGAESTTTLNTVVATESATHLLTARIEVCNPAEPSKRSIIRAMFDPASHKSYMSTNLAKLLKCSKGRVEQLAVNRLADETPVLIETNDTQISVFFKDGNSEILTVKVLPLVTANLMRHAITPELRDHLLSCFDMADTLPDSDKSEPVDLLIGNNYALDMLRLNQSMPLKNGLWLINTKFGFILSGCDRDNTSPSSSVCMMTLEQPHKSSPVVEYPTEPKDDFETKWIEDDWSLKSIGISDSIIADDDQLALQYYDQTTEKRGDRFYVSLPWVDKNVLLQDNYSQAYGRLRTLIRKFADDTVLFGKYSDIMRDQLQRGIIEEVDDRVSVNEGMAQPAGPRIHYLPHQYVLTPTKATTKVRVVYDGSAKSHKNDNSLNECVLRGPVLLVNLVGVLIRSRLQPIMMIADVEKAFLMIGLHERDRDATRFLYLRDMNVASLRNNLQTYRFARIPFGLKCSPFLLEKSIDYLLEHEVDYPETAARIRGNIYVDNLGVGAENEESAIKLYQETKSIFKSGCMKIRDWRSNSAAVNAAIDTEDFAQHEAQKLLGVQWNTRDDTLMILGSEDKMPEQWSKRRCLKAHAKIYDPLGWWQPLHVSAKIFLQELWSEGYAWDTPLPDELSSRWLLVYNELRLVSTYAIPRYVGVLGANSCEVIGFADASAKAYAAAVYVKHSNAAGDVAVHLVFARSRLAPTKGVSIPRMELLASLIGVRAVLFVSEQLRIDVTNKFLWLDSQCVLKWIKGNKELSRFVHNRIVEVKEAAQYMQLRYVRSEENPADLPTKGCTFAELVTSQLWWQGPAWLRQPSAIWPTYDVPIVDQSVLDAVAAEEKTSIPLHAHALLAGEGPTEKHSLPFDLDPSKFSRLDRLLRVTAYSMRFTRTHWKKKGLPVFRDNTLVAAEIRIAQSLWDAAVQKDGFGEIFEALRRKKSHVLIKKLGIKLDGNEMLRSYGRFNNAELPDDTRAPILLPREHAYTRLVIDEAHRRRLHAGATHTLATVRQRYFIPQARPVIKTVLKDCKICTIHEGGAYKPPPMPPIPKFRLSSSTPFAYTGLDYFGPMYVSCNGETKKVWCLLFTCLVVRAVHLELVEDMTSYRFILGLERFIARRGTPQEIVCDNAPTFKLAAATCEVAWRCIIVKDDVQNYATSKSIKFRFIVALSPWMGGMYERMVGIVKKALRKAIPIGQRRLCLESDQLYTVLTQVEAVVNSRPLTYITNEDSMLVITPGHFLSLNPKSGVPSFQTDFTPATHPEDDPDFNPNPDPAEQLAQIWKKGHSHIERAARSFNEDYVLSLRERYESELSSKKGVVSRTPSTNDIVLVAEQGLPRGQWLVGRIQAVKQSQDGAVRSATVAFPSGRTLNRSITLLHPIECPPQDVPRNDGIDLDATLPYVSDSVSLNQTVPYVGDYDAAANIVGPDGRPIRDAAVKARKQVQQWMSFNITDDIGD